MIDDAVGIAHPETVLLEAVRSGDHTAAGSRRVRCNLVEPICTQGYMVKPFLTCTTDQYNGIALLTGATEAGDLAITFCLQPGIGIKPATIEIGRASGRERGCHYV